MQRVSFHVGALRVGQTLVDNNSASIVVVGSVGGGGVVVVVGGGVVGVVLVHFHQCNPDTVQGVNGERDFLPTHRHRSLLPIAFSFALFRNTKRNAIRNAISPESTNPKIRISCQQTSYSRFRVHL